MEWKKCKGSPRIAGVSSFGITGTDAHVILEESPELSCKKVLAADDNLDCPLHILKISGKTAEALELLLEKYKTKMLESEAALSDIAFSSNCGRANFPYRAAIIARTKDDAISCIDQRKYLRDEVSADSQTKICFLFTGQGSQYPGMAKRLYEWSPVFQMHFDYCDKIMEKSYNISLKEIMWTSNAASREELTRTIYSQTSIFCVEYALLKLWESWGVKPNYALGHSLGEFAAAVCARIISVDDAIKIVAERSKLIDELPHGKMLVIQADYNKVKNEMKKFAEGDNNKLLDCAAINSSSQTVVVGDSDRIIEFLKYCTENKMKCIVLAATHAFHSKHMNPMLEKYRAVADTINGIQGQSCEYMSGVRGNVPMNQVDAEYWFQHTRERVNFLGASKKAVELGCNIFIEIGPQPVLSVLTMMNNDTSLSCLPSLKRKEDEWETILNTVGKLYVKGIEIDWTGFDQFYNRNKVRLPHYPFIGKKFWPDLLQVSGRNSIHPLIGSVLSNASSIKIFQNGVNLVTHAYIKDHVIGQTLEMCIAAGLATVEGSTDSLSKPIRPMKVENLMIKAPLALQHDKTRQLQTVVELNKSCDSLNDWNDMNVQIFHRDDVTGVSESWLEHAAATFSPLPIAEELIIPFDVEHLQRETLLQHSISELVNKMYDKLASLGLKFGPVFRRLENVWKNEQSNNLMAKVKVPENTDEQSGVYIVHPVILDAMVQAIMMFKLIANINAKLYVPIPIRIGKFVWMSNQTSESSDDVYIHVYDNSSGDSSLSTSSYSALLVDLNGKVLASMSKVEFIDTKVKAVEAVLEQHTSAMPDLWEETWRPHVGPSQHRHDLAICRKERFYDDKFLEDLNHKFNELTPEKRDTLIKLDRFAYLNFLRCLYDCGWVPTLDAIFTEGFFVAHLSIQKEFTKMLTYILQVLEEEGILQNMGLAMWKVTAIPPTSIKIEEELSLSIITVDFVKTFNPSLIIIRDWQKLLRNIQRNAISTSYHVS